MLGWAITVGYFAISAVTYIKVLPVCYRRKLKEENRLYPSIREHNEVTSRESAIYMSAWRALIWVYPLLLEGPARKLHEYAWKPITEEKERIARLAQDRDDWYEKSLNSTDPKERRMSRDIWKVLDETLKGE